MTINSINRKLSLLAVPTLYFLTFAEATYEKLAGGVPDWFIEKFTPTFFSAIPGGVQLAFYLIAIGELAVTVLAVVSVIGILRGSQFANSLVQTTVVVSGWVFAALSFGMRLTGDYSSAAQLFYYAAFSLILYFLWPANDGQAKLGTK